MLRVAAAGLFLLSCGSTWALDKGQTVVVKADAELKRSGQVVGQVKAGEILRVRAVRGAWVEVDDQKPGWLRVSNLSTQDEAAEHLSNLIEQQPDDESLRLTRVRLHMANKKLAAAEDELNELARLNPASAEVKYQRGLLNVQRNRAGDALRYFTEAIEINGDDPRFYIARGRLYHQQKDFAETTADYELAIALGSADPFILNTLAWWYATSLEEQQRDGKKAVKYATQACELTHFDNWMYVDTLAAAYAEANDFTNALKYQEFANRLCQNPNFKAEIEARLKLYRLNQPFRTEPK